MRFLGAGLMGFKLFRDTEEGEKIKYGDYNSLYPFVNKKKIRFHIKQLSVKTLRKFQIILV